MSTVPRSAVPCSRQLPRSLLIYQHTKKSSDRLDGARSWGGSAVLLIRVGFLL
ncbi:MAG: hypothetical protein F6K55_06850 [Moorea sp. SIO4A3]|nr:hypothetical protein [Moorena sp. SIO4A3]